MIHVTPQDIYSFFWIGFFLAYMVHMWLTYVRLKRKANRFQKELETVRDGLRDKDKIISSHTRDCQSLSKELEKVRNQRNGYQADIVQLQSQLQHLRGTLAEVEREKDYYKEIVNRPPAPSSLFHCLRNHHKR